MSEPRVRLNRQGAMATVILNRPDRGNAVDSTMLRDLTQLFDDLQQERKLRSVVLTGAGRHFCSGADQEELDRLRGLPEATKHWQDEAEGWLRLLETLLRFPKPIVAAVGGPVQSLGACLMLACDVVVASEAATFAVADARSGGVCGLAAPLLAMRAGGGAAGYLLLSGKTIDAAQALRLGLFHETVPEEHVWVRAAALADEIAAASPSALLMTKRLLHETVFETLLSQLASGAAALATSRTLADAAEEADARNEGRLPEWI